MTTLQLRVVLAVTDLGSITAAARELNISQPNASNSIHALEEEIGYNIFHRGKGGTRLTEKGLRFIEHARHILAENDSILGIRNQQKFYRLRLGTCNYYSAIEPFIKLCEAHRDDPEADFRYLSVSIEDGIQKLINYDLDVVFAPALKSQLASVNMLCKQHNLAMIPICELPTVISVRKDHPAALDGRCQNLTQGSDALKDYPYITYRNLTEDSGATAYNDSDFIQCSYKIYVDEVDIRLRLVACTNAFSFGLVTSESIRDRYQLVSFPVPGITAELFCLTRTIDRDRREITEYIELLRQELHLPPAEPVE